MIEPTEPPAPSIKKVMDLKPDSLLFGHGVPIVGNAGVTLDAFAQRIGLM